MSDREMFLLENPATGKTSEFDPKTADVLIKRKGFKKVGTSKKKDTSLENVVAGKDAAKPGPAAS